MSEQAPGPHNLNDKGVSPEKTSGKDPVPLFPPGTRPGLPEPTPPNRIKFTFLPLELRNVLRTRYEYEGTELVGLDDVPEHLKARFEAAFRRKEQNALGAQLQDIDEESGSLPHQPQDRVGRSQLPFSELFPPKEKIPVVAQRVLTMERKLKEVAEEGETPDQVLQRLYKVMTLEEIRATLGVSEKIMGAYIKEREGIAGRGTEEDSARRREAARRQHAENPKLGKQLAERARIHAREALEQRMLQYTKASTIEEATAALREVIEKATTKKGLMETLGVDNEEVNRLLKYLQIKKKYIAPVKEDLVAKTLFQEMEAMGYLETLSDRVQAIIRARYFPEEGKSPPSLENVGRQFGISRTRVQQIEIQVIDNFSKKIAKESNS